MSKAMKLRIEGGRTLSGTVRLPSSKSFLHRALICAALADGPTTIACRGWGEDVSETVEALRVMGADVMPVPDGFLVCPVDRFTPGVISVNKSAATFRFFLALAAFSGQRYEIRVSQALRARPFIEMVDGLRRAGADIRVDDSAVFVFPSGIGNVDFPGNISSQFFSGVLMALPLTGGKVSVRPSAFTVGEGHENSACFGRDSADTSAERTAVGPADPASGDAERDAGTVAGGPENRKEERPVSPDYVLLTQRVMSLFGARAELGATVPAGRYRSPGFLRAEDDASSASFWWAANALGSRIAFEDACLTPFQPDRSVERLVGEIAAGRLSDVNISGIPDAFPVLAVVAAKGAETVFRGTDRLRGKESDRVDSVCKLIRSLGGRALAGNDSITIFGDRLKGGLISAEGDHRIAMAAAVAATICDGDVVLDGAETVGKSYPAFFDDFAALGGRITNIF